MNNSKQKPVNLLDWKSWIFHPFVTMGVVLDTKVFPTAPVKTEEERIAEQMEAAKREEMQAAQTIRESMFTQHMARARIRALEDWNHGRNLLCDHMNNPIQGPQYSETHL